MHKELEAVTAQKHGAEQQLEQLRSELQAAVSERDAATQKLHDAEAIEHSSATIENAEPAIAKSGAPNGLSDESLRKALEDKIAAAEAKAAEFEQKANVPGQDGRGIQEEGGGTEAST
ncbi:hypothetical protein E4U54_001005 [Claviceps lovelessii]|nr:hypothetical protein E4U54_001005 [Claviceps lovelessii]